MRHKDRNRERIAERVGHRKRDREREIKLRKQKVCLSRTKMLVRTRVSRKYSQKYSINIPLPAFQTDTLGMFIMKHLE